MDTQPETAVIKVGGNEIDDDGFLAGFVAAVAELRQHTPVVIVHGGGKEIGELHQRLGVPFEFVDGLRVTTAGSLRLVEMVLSGLVNTRLTRWLVNGGVQALGASGVDLGIVRVEPLRPNGQDIGYVGRIVAVQADPLRRWLAEDVTPVISPISLGTDGQSYNVNADQVAAAVAVAVGASRLVFVSNVPGVLLEGAAATKLTIDQAEAHIASGQIFGGMIPKVRAAIEAVQTGVPAAVITNLAGLAAGGGTAVLAGKQGDK
jgi:acetylglutamate kinase